MQASSPAAHPSSLATGLDAQAVGDWLLGVVLRDATPPLRFRLIKSGRTNLTYRVTDRHGRAWIVRRPPLGELPRSAHDVEREHRILAQLSAAGLPVPRPLAFCWDPTVTGAQFSVLEHVDGIVVDTGAVAAALDSESRRRAGLSLALTLAQLHSFDAEQLQLGASASGESYATRQLRRWRSRWDAIKTRELPRLDTVADRLTEGMPEEHEVALVHGAYRLDNVVIDDRGELRAVLDWELCTIGDPLADLGLLLTAWPQRGDDLNLGDDPYTCMAGFPTREELVETYAAATGRDLTNLPFFRALGAWKAAIIAECTYRRMMDDPRRDHTAPTMGARVDDLVELAEEATWRAGL